MEKRYCQLNRLITLILLMVYENLWKKVTREPILIPLIKLIKNYLNNSIF